MKIALTIASLLAPATLLADSGEFRHIGDFIIRSRLKVVDGKSMPIAIKPLRLSAFTDGVTVRLSSSDDAGHASAYTIYRSDGIGRQNAPGGALEVVPGVQATTQQSGIFRQLRLTEDTLTITTFPGVSNQIVVTHATAAPPARATPVPEPEEIDPETAASP